MKQNPVWIAAAVCAALGSGQVAQPFESQGPLVRSRAEQLAAKGDYRGAIEEYRKAVGETPNNAGLHNRLGVCYQKAGDLGAAQKEYQKALKLNPGYAEARNNLGTVQHGRKKYKKAVEEYRRAIEAKPSLPTAYKNMGTAYLALGKLDEGMAAFEQALQLDPAAFDPAQGEGVGVSGLNLGLQSFMLAKIHARNGDLESALLHLARAQDAGFRDLDQAAKDPDFKGLAQDARFVALTR